MNLEGQQRNNCMLRMLNFLSWVFAALAIVELDLTLDPLVRAG